MDITFPALLWEQINAHIFAEPDTRRSADEQMGFVLASHCVSAGRTTLLGHEVLLAGTGDLLDQSPSAIAPTGEFVAAMLTRCQMEGWSLIEFHSHPFDRSTRTTFSGIDWTNDRAKMPPIAQSLPEHFRHATLVIGQSSLDGHYYDKTSASILPIRRVVISGGPEGLAVRRTIIPTSARAESASTTGDNRRYARQRPFLGETQDELARAAVAIVGLGGIGSIVALQLAHLGVGELILIDPDKVEESNLNRLLGVGPNDVGKPKVEVIADLIRHVAPSAKVATSNLSVLEGPATELIKGTDLILGCVDNHGARLVLNHISLRYLIPLLDAGTGLVVDETGNVVHAGGQVQLVAPGRGCLECRGFIDPKQASFDLSSESVQAYERAHGYGSDEPAPSVIFLNGVVASHQVSDAAKFFQVDESHGLTDPSLLIFDLLGSRTYRVSAPGRPDCPSCGSDGVVGLGDLAPLRASQAIGGHPPVPRKRRSDRHARPDTDE